MRRIRVTRDFGNEIRSMNRLSVLLFILFFVLSFLIIILSRFFVRKSVAPVKDAMLSQRQFISDASHELKTPLTVIINNVGNLQKNIEKIPALQGAEGEGIRNNILGIDEMSGRMKHLTESLLDLSRLENWQDRKSQLEKLSFSKLVEHECMYFEPLFFEQGRRLEYTVEKELYTLQKKKNTLLLTVSNSMEKELSKEEKEHLFHRFYRLDEAHSGGTGYGLGLAIAREIVLMHRGEIRVESEKNQISFLLRLNAY